MANIFTYETGWLKGKNGTTGNYKYICTIDLNSQSIANNTSNITITLALVGESNSGTLMWDANATKNQPYGTLTGAASATGNRMAKWRKTTTPTTVVTWTGDIAHNDDGTKTISEAFNWVAGELNYYPATQTFTTASVALPTIARASTVTFSTTTIASTTGSLSYTITSKANFYHKLEWALGTGSGTLLNGTNINKTTYTGTIPYTTLLASLPASANGTLTLTLKTYSDSGMTNLIGTKTTTGTIAVNTGAIKPTTSITGTSIYSTPLAGVYVAGYSRAQLDYTATNSYGASGLTNSFSTSRGSMATSSTTTTSGSVLTNAFPASATDYTATLTAKTTDSRGAVGTPQTANITVKGYSDPVITATAKRCDADGTADEAGAYVVAVFSATCSLSAEGNVVSISATMNGSPITSGTVYSLPEEDSATFVFTATDAIKTSTRSLTVPSANFPLDLYDDGNGHIGAGIGKVAEADKMIINMPVDLRNTLTATGDIAAPNANIGSTTDGASHAVSVSSNAGEIKMFANAGGSATRGLWLPAHGTGSAKAAISVDTNNNVTLNGNATTATDATNAKLLKPYPNNRPSTLAQPRWDATMTHFLSDNRASDQPSAQFGHVTDWQWDNNNGIMGTQLYLAVNQNQKQSIALRGSNLNVWNDWKFVHAYREIWTGTTAGQGSKTISLNVSGYSYLKIWAMCYSVCFSFDLDLTKAPAYTIAGASDNTAYRTTGVSPVYTAGASTQRFENYYCTVEVNSAKNTITIVEMGYFYGSGTRVARNNNAGYYIYKIEGYL